MKLGGNPAPRLYQERTRFEMKKRTMISKLQESWRQELKAADLELVGGGKVTITQDGGGHVIAIQDKEPM